MPRQTSNPFSFSSLRSGPSSLTYSDSNWNNIPSTNLSLSQFYRGGSFIPNINFSPNNSVPSSGQINLSSLKGTWGFLVDASVLTQGTAIGTFIIPTGKYYAAVYTYYYGFSSISSIDGGGSPPFGSMSNSTFTTPSGTYIISAFFSQLDYNSSYSIHLFIRKTDNSFPSNSDDVFISFLGPSYPNASLLNRSAATYTNYSSGGLNYSRWHWTASSVPGGGQYSIQRRFYG